jgi:hypothetical protein
VKIHNNLGVLSEIFPKESGFPYIWKPYGLNIEVKKAKIKVLVRVL